jgi:hypothetical protein
MNLSPTADEFKAAGNGLADRTEFRRMDAESLCQIRTGG